MQLKNKLMTVGCVAVAAAALVAGTACNEHEMAPFSKSLSSGKKQATSSGSARPVDILFVVDNSISMTEEQADLDSNFKIFLDRLVEANADFRLATVSTSYSGNAMAFETHALNTNTGADILKSNGVSDNEINKIKAACRSYYEDGLRYDFNSNGWIDRDKSPSDSSVDDPWKGKSKEWIDYNDFYLGSDSDTAKLNERKQVLQNLFRCQAIMGIDGDPTEKGLATMKSSLSAHRSMSDLSDAIKNFKRPGSILSVVFVTDENDCSSTTKMLVGDECEKSRNIEDACIMAREDSVQLDESQFVDNSDNIQPTYLQLSSGLALEYEGVKKSIRDWCVQGDEEARNALLSCLADEKCKSYIKCPGDSCSNDLAPRSDFYNFLINYVIASNEVFYQEQNSEMFLPSNVLDANDRRSKYKEMASSDIIIASIINRDQGIRYDVNLPENWCGTAGSQSYRYQLFAEMFGNDPIYAPICCKNEQYVVKQVSTDANGQKVSTPTAVCESDANGSNGAFGPVLSVIGQRIGEAVNTLCADAAPITCIPADCNEQNADGSYSDNPRSDKAATCPCLYGCKASAAHLSNTPNEYFLCNEFEFKVGTLPKDAEKNQNAEGLAEYRPYSSSDFSIDYDSTYCKTRTGSPIQINLNKTEVGRDIIFEYPKAVSGK